jgi:hypothetical protein
VTGTPPGNTATVTIIVSPDTSGLFTISTTAIIGGTDGVPSNNSAIETTTVRTLGGAQIAIAAAAGGGTALTWRGGDAQAGYYIGRLAGGTASVLPTSGTPLPATATAFVDPDPIPGQANCYAVAPVDTVGPLGRSALVCQIPDTASASGAPSAFTLRFSNGEALLTWSGPGAQTGYALGIYPQDGSTPRYRRMPWTAAREAVTIPTCFVVVAETASTVLGHSNFLCAVPGVGTIPEPLP